MYVFRFIPRNADVSRTYIRKYKIYTIFLITITFIKATRRYQMYTKKKKLNFGVKLCYDRYLKSNSVI